jgi:fructose-bisphosphate aldolase, class I
MTSLSKIIKKGKALYLAYDQGLEHGPSNDFNDKNVNPLYILKIAKEGKYQGIVFQKGIAEKYNNEIKKSKVPLILKLNGKTSLYKGEPISRQIATVKEAKALGAKAVGYTIYIGSQHESIMFQEFEKIKREAKKYNLPTITWIYPRGKTIKNDSSRENMSYAARTALELGSDIVKLKYNGKPKDLKWAVKSSGRTKVVVAGGSKKTESVFLKQAKEIINTGAIGLAVGRNVWQHNKPLEITKKIQKIIWS